MDVKKRDGSTEEFDSEKLRDSLLNAGATIDNATKVANAVGDRVRDGTRTEEIKRIAKAELKRLDPTAAQRYGTRPPGAA